MGGALGTGSHGTTRVTAKPSLLLSLKIFPIFHRTVLRVYTLSENSATVDVMASISSIAASSESPRSVAQLKTTLQSSSL